MRKASPTFVAAALVVGLSAFVLLSMLFYGPADYFERADSIAKEEGLRYSVAALFFKSFGVGAYVGWLVILAWAVIVFFREAVGELAIRAVSLVVAVFSGAALADLLGSTHLGGHLGGAIGAVLQANFGSTLGVILIGAIFGISFLLATDFGFITYYREARGALAVAEEEEEEDQAPAEPTDLLARIELAAQEAEKQETADTEDSGVSIAAEEPAETEESPIRIDLRPPIEEEPLDEDLLTEDSREVLAAERAAEEPPTAVAEAPPAEEPAAEEEPVPETTPPSASLDAVFDALVGPRIVAEAPVEHEPQFILDDEIHVMSEREDEVVATPPAEPAEEPPSPEETVTVGPILIDDEVIIVDDEIFVTPEKPEPAEREELLPFMSGEKPADEELPVLEDIHEETEEKAGGLRSLFKRRKPKAEAMPAADVMLDDAARLVIERGRASVVLLQRRLDIGYTRASRIVDSMEREGLVGPLLESGSREVLMTREEWESRRSR